MSAALAFLPCAASDLGAKTSVAQDEAIFVTTADGPEGLAMATTLLELRGVRVLAGVADAESPASRKLKAAGAELRVVSDPPRPQAFAGSSWVFVLAPLTADRLARGRALIDAAQAGGVASAALLSVIGAGPEAPASLGAYYALERHLAEVWPAASRVILRTYFYQQNLLLWSADVRTTGALRLPLAPGSCFAPLYESDVAAVLLAVVRSRVALGRVLHLTGPRAMSGATLAQTAATVVRAPALRFEAVSRDAAARILESAGGLDRSEGSLLLDLMQLQARPEACGSYPSPDVRAVTGRDATDVGVFFAEHAEAFRPPPLPSSLSSVGGAVATPIARRLLGPETAQAAASVAAAGCAFAAASALGVWMLLRGSQAGAETSYRALQGPSEQRAGH